MRLAVVILNFHTAVGTQNCLSSLCGQIDPAQDRVFVVDNGSQDGSADSIERAIDEHDWNEWAEVVALPENLGFAGGNNRVLGTVDADAYLLLNSDTVVLPGAIAELWTGLATRPNAGIVGASLEWPNGTRQTSAFRDPRPLGEIVTAAAMGPLTRLLATYEVPLPISPQPTFPDWVCFAAVLLRRDLIRSVGLLDDGYFLYFEDVDYCRRARDAGWCVMVWPPARVIHLNGWSQAPSEEGAGSAYWHASRARYYGKFFGRSGLWWANVCWMFGRFVSFTRDRLGNERSYTGAGRAARIWTNWREPVQGRSSRADHTVSACLDEGLPGTHAPVRDIERRG